MLCPPQESLSLNGRQSNCHSKYAAAHGWRRNRFGNIKVMKLGLGVVCFSERGCILGSSPAVTKPQKDHVTYSNLREELHFKTLFLYALREKFFGQKEEKNPNRIRGRQGKYTQANQ